MDMLRNLLESCTEDDARTLIHCLAMRFPGAAVGLTPVGARQLEILNAIEEGHDSSPALQKKLGLTVNNICTRLQGLEKAGLVVIDRSHPKHNAYRRVTINEILAQIGGGSDEA